MKKTKFVELPEHVIKYLKSNLDADYDSIAIEYLVLLEMLGKQTVQVSEMPKDTRPQIVQRVLGPYLRECGYRFGYRSLTHESVMWGFIRTHKVD